MSSCIGKPDVHLKIVFALIALVLFIPQAARADAISFTVLTTTQIGDAVHRSFFRAE
jgi:hypothetical protein